MSLIRIPNADTAVPQQYELQVADLVTGLLPPTTDSNGDAVTVSGSLGKIVDGANTNKKVEFTYSVNLGGWYERETVTQNDAGETSINNLISGMNVLLAGETGVGSPLSRMNINNVALSTLLDSVTTAQNIGGAASIPVVIKGITALRPLVGTVTIGGYKGINSVADLTNTAVVPIPAGAAESTYEILPSGVAREFPAGCTVQCSVAADGPFIEVNWGTL